MNKLQLFSLLVIYSIIGFNVQSCSPSDTQEKTETSQPEKTEFVSPPSSPIQSQDIEPDMKDIRSKCNSINDATNLRLDSTTVECDQRTIKVKRKLADNGHVFYLKETITNELSLDISEYYFWDNQIIFMYQQKFGYMNGTNSLVEQRSYFYEGQMIHCLDKIVSTQKGREELIKLAKRKTNITVYCSPNERDLPAKKIRSFAIENAKAYYCNP